MTIVEDFTDLAQLSNEKLLKLRDVANSNARKLNKEAADAMQRLRDILDELEKRKNV